MCLIDRVQARRSRRQSRLLAAMALCASLATPVLAQTATVDLPGRPFGIAATADGTTLFVALSARGSGQGAVAVLHRQGGTAVLDHVVTVGGVPAGIGLSHDGRLLAVAAGRETLLLDADRLRDGADSVLIARLPGEAGAIEAAFSPDDRVLAISEERADRITLVDPGQPGVPPRHVPVGQAPVGLAFAPDGRTLYAVSEASGSGGVCPGDDGTDHVGPGIASIIDIATGGASTAELGCSAVRIVLSPDGGTAFVSLRAENAVAAFATASLRRGSGQRQAVVHVGVAPVGIALDGAGHLLVANSDRFQRGWNSDLSCARVASEGLTAIRQIGSGVFPREVLALPGGGFVVSLYGSRALQFVTGCG